MSFIRSLWRFVSRPSQSLALGTLVIIGAVGGVVLWGGFNWAMELSSTETFCISCHEMESTVYQELNLSFHLRFLRLSL